MLTWSFSQRQLHIRVMVMHYCGIKCVRPLLLFEQLIFASMDHVYIGEVGPVLMMELVSLVFLWPKLYSYGLV